MQDIIQRAKRKQMEYLPFSFPLGLNTEKTKLIFSFGTLHSELLLTRDGLIHLFQHLRIKGANRKELRDLYLNNLTEFVQRINQIRAAQESQDLWRKNQSYILAVHDGFVYGMVARYNPKSNAEVLADIEESGLSIGRVRLTDREMNVYIPYSSKQGFELGINVRNGETGFVAFGYELYIYKGDYTFSSPEFDKSRHMTPLSRVENNLTDLYAELKDIDFHNFILETESKHFAQIILQEEDFEKLHELVEPFDSRLKKLYALLGVLHTKASERGWKTVTKKALDKVYEHIMENL